MMHKKGCNYIDIARFIGIYLVMLGHMGYSTNELVYRDWVYTFHMPLFFIISGILHKKKTISLSQIGRLSFSLLIPFVIYFFAGLTVMYIRSRGQLIINFEIILKELITANVRDNLPLWFFITLFQVKFIALFCKKNIHFIVLSIASFIVWIVMQRFKPEGMHEYPYRINVIFMAFPIFAIGYLIKDYLDLIKSRILQLGIIVIAGLSIFFHNHYYGRIDMAEAFAPNYILWFVVAIIASVGIVYLSKLVTPYLACNFIQTISRGTMLIVGTHFIIMQPLLVPMTNHFLVKMLYVFILLALYYIPIRLTYNRNLFSYFYGKRPHKKATE